MLVEREARGVNALRDFLLCGTDERLALKDSLVVDDLVADGDPTLVSIAVFAVLDGAFAVRALGPGLRFSCCHRDPLTSASSRRTPTGTPTEGYTTVDRGRQLSTRKASDEAVCGRQCTLVDVRR